MSASQVSHAKPTITLHVVASLDGFIARHDNDVSWLESTGDVYEAGVTEESGMDIVSAIDCYVLGARTYEHALELGWPYGDTPTIVVSHRPLPTPYPSVELYSGDLERLVRDVLAPRYQNVWLVGGAMLCREFLRLGLVDKIRLVIAPVLLGDGLRLFDGPISEQRWRLEDVVAYKSGLVELAYGATSQPDSL